MNTSYPALIDDTPSSEDKFDAHKRLAIAIAKLVNKDKGGKTISLEGEWGAGKSTVVKLLSKELESTPKTKIITYDAWVHSGDPLRRAFLNTMIDSLASKGWLIEPDVTHKTKFNHRFISKTKQADTDKLYWENKKDELSGKFKVTQKNISPTFTQRGRLLILSLLLLPISSLTFVNILVSYLKSQSLFFFAEPSLLYLFWISLFFVASPFLIIAETACYQRKRGLGQDNIFALLANKSVTEEETSTIESPDPSSIEFQELFTEILSMALSEPSRKLILVIDNLDRLKPDLAESVWSMLRSFIDDSVLQNEAYEWTSRLWVIIPVATNVKDYQTIDKSKEPNATAAKLNNNSEQFLEKVFQVRFHLPPPVLADWQNYLMGLLNRAFENEEESDLKLIIRLYEGYLRGDMYEGIHNSNSNTKPTPRSLLHFVNDLVVLKLLWNEQFKLSTLTAYTLSTRNINIIEALQQKKIPNSRVTRLLGEKITQDFPSIYFNVSDVKKAQEILMRPIAEEYLRHGQAIKLRNEIETNVYFESILDSVITQSLSDWGNYDLDAFFKALVALNELNNTPSKTGTEEWIKLNKHTVKLIELSIVHVFNGNKALPLLHPLSGKGVLAATDICQSDLVLDTFYRDLQGFSIAKELSGDRFIPTIKDNVEWFNQLEEICLNGHISDRLKNAADNSIHLPIAVEDWELFCNRFDTKETQVILNKFRPYGDDREIANYLSSTILASKFNDAHCKILTRAYQQNNLTPYESILVSTKEWMSSPTAITGKSIEVVISHFLKICEKNEAFKLFLRELAINGVAHHYFYQTIEVKEYTAAAALLLVILKNITTATRLTNTHLNSTTGFTLLQQIVATPPKYKNIIDAFIELSEKLDEQRVIIDLVLKDANSYIFAKAVFDGYMNKKNFYSKFSVENLQSEAQPFVTNVFENNAEIRHEIVSYFLNEKNLLNIVNSKKLSTSQAWLYCSIVQVQKTTDPIFLKNCKEFLGKISEDIWVSSIYTLTWLSWLVIELQKRDSKLSLGSNFRGALIKLANSSVTDATKVLIKKEYFNELVKCSKPQEYKKMASAIYEMVKNAESKLDNKFWFLFGDIFDRFILDSKQCDKLIEEALKSSVKNQDANCMNRIGKMLDVLPRNLIDLSTPSIKNLRASIGVIQKTTQDNMLKRAANKIRGHIKMPRTLQKKS